MAKSSTRKALTPAQKAAAERRKPPGGRKAGSKNKIGVLLKDAIIMAAEARGSDGKGKEGLVGYLKWMARNETRAFASLLGRVLPLHVTGTVTHEHKVFRTKEEIIAEFKQRDLPVPVLFAEALPPGDIVEADYVEVLDAQEAEDDDDEEDQ